MRPAPAAPLRVPTPSHNPGYHPSTSPVGTDLRAVRTADAALSEKSPYPQSSPENTNPVVQPQLSPECLLGRDRSPSGPEPLTLALSEKSPYPGSAPESPNPIAQPQLSPENLPGRDRSPSGPHRRRGAVGDIALPQSSPENTNPVVQPRLSPECLLGRDRSPSGPHRRHWRFRRNRPTPEAPLRTPTPWNNPSHRPRTSQVGTDLRAVRHRRRGAFGEIALPQKRP